MSLVQTKSLLAKLMATENLHIEQRNVSTASFDVVNRILTVPILNDTVTSDQYDLFMGHEVGHALYTPLDGLKRASELNYSMSVMNVLEDSRIERKIKIKYPGIRQCFIRAYKELMENDFFGTSDKDLNTLNFIDRFNLYCKAGIDTGIVFSDEEKAIVNEIENTITYDDVMEVYKKVSDYMKTQNQPEPLESSLGFGFADEDFDGPTEKSPGSNSENSQSGEKSESKSSENQEDHSDSDKANKSGDNKSSDSVKDTIESGKSTGTGKNASNSNKPI